jgi:Protein of unknown function (DUF2924)
MALNIDKVVAQMRRMTVNELQQKFAKVHGERPRGRNKQWLIKRIAWRLQANEEGGLSERALRRATELANDVDLRLTAPRATKHAAVSNSDPGGSIVSVTLDPRLPMPGTLITRTYKRRTIHVKVLRDGFEFEGEKYKSLSAVARAITGTHWNGFHFFGLHKQEATG